MAVRINGKPLIPDLAELTRLVTEQIESAHKDSLTTLIGHLPVEQRGNLEAVLNYVRALAALPGTEIVRSVEVSTLSELDSAICRVIRENVDADLPSRPNPYSILALWIRSVRRISPTQIFTTNYDLLMEQALERERVAYFDGFVGSRQPVFDLEAIEEDSLPTRWTLLWKLHGSINWSQDKNGNVVRRPAGTADGSSALVYPSHLKYDQSRRLPYLAMLDRLKAFLRKPGAILISCGFSYRDQHINEVIDQALRANPTASVHALLYGNLEEYRDASQLALGLANLSVFAQESAIIGGLQGIWSEPNDPTGESSKETECLLGDFNEFSQMLQKLLGQRPPPEAAQP